MFKVLKKSLLISQITRGYASKSLFVGNLPFRATADDVRDHFHKFDVSRVTIPTDQMGRSRGFAFVELDDTQADQAILEMNETEFQGRSIRVDNSQSSSRFSKN